MNQVESVNLWALVENAVEEIKPEVLKKRLHFRYRMEHVTAVCVEADGTLLHNMLLELLKNAVMFTYECGDVILSVTELMREKDSITLEFYVQDDGIGMTEEEKNRVFDREPEEYEGAGGLEYVLRQARLLGARVSCESAKDYGTIVRIIVTLPCRSEGNTRVRDESRDICNFEGKNILLVEDHLLNLDIAKRFLEKVGIGVETALNGREAVEMYKKNGAHYDLILMDIRMPVMDGIAACGEIRALEGAERSIPIIALTASAYEGDTARSREAGMNDTILKPIDPKKLYGVLRQYLFKNARA